MVTHRPECTSLNALAPGMWHGIKREMVEVSQRLTKPTRTKRHPRVAGVPNLRRGVRAGSLRGAGAGPGDARDARRAVPRAVSRRIWTASATRTASCFAVRSASRYTTRSGAAKQPRASPVWSRKDAPAGAAPGDPSHAPRRSNREGRPGVRGRGPRACSRRSTVTRTGSRPCPWWTRSTSRAAPGLRRFTGTTGARKRNRRSWSLAWTSTRTRRTSRTRSRACSFLRRAPREARVGPAGRSSHPARALHRVERSRHRRAACHARDELRLLRGGHAERGEGPSGVGRDPGAQLGKRPPHRRHQRGEGVFASAPCAARRAVRPHRDQLHGATWRRDEETKPPTLFCVGFAPPNTSRPRTFFFFRELRVVYLVPRLGRSPRYRPRKNGRCCFPSPSVNAQKPCDVRRTPLPRAASRRWRSSRRRRAAREARTRMFATCCDSRLPPRPLPRNARAAVVLTASADAGGPSKAFRVENVLKTSFRARGGVRTSSEARAAPVAPPSHLHRRSPFPAR